MDASPKSDRPIGRRKKEIPPSQSRQEVTGSRTLSPISNQSNVVIYCCHHRAPVAQLDRAIASGAIGREFESLRARHSPVAYNCGPNVASYYCMPKHYTCSAYSAALARNLRYVGFRARVGQHDNRRKPGIGSSIDRSACAARSQQNYDSVLREGDGVIAVGTVVFHRKDKNAPARDRTVIWTDFRRKQDGTWRYVFRHAHWPLEAASAAAAPARKP